MKISKRLPLAFALCAFAFLGQSTGPVLADGFQHVSLLTSPNPNSSPTPLQLRARLVAACLANHLGCSSDGECCSHRCVSIRTGTQVCVGKNYIIR
jgi:hypothetical protein